MNAPRTRGSTREFALSAISLLCRSQTPWSIGSDATLQDAIEAAQRTDTLVYSILFSDLHAYEWGVPEGARALLRIPKETGGRAATPAPSR